MLSQTASTDQVVNETIRGLFLLLAFSIITCISHLDACRLFVVLRHVKSPPPGSFFLFLDFFLLDEKKG